jgi:DNA-binding MarR family transcriptional regulator
MSKPNSCDAAQPAHEKERRPPPPLVVPCALLAVPLSHVAFRVLCVLHSHARGKGVCWPSAERIAEKAHCRRPSVFKALTELERKGLVARSKREGSTYRNEYALLPLSGEDD